MNTDHDDKPTGKLLPRCGLCGQVPSRGIRGGYMISHIFVCYGCEESIINLVMGSENYKSYLEKLHGLFK
ncbi:MAG: sigma factor G inhibitor Gin [Methylocystaceae bacterium]